jgi:four helix bundle protein
MSERISSFRDLKVYQLSLKLQQEIFVISKKFPRDETYSLTSQVRRSSRSVGANITEAWQKRRYEAHFVSKLSDADGEQAETQHWVDTAKECEYIADAERNRIRAGYTEIGRMLGKMMSEPEKWCRRFRDE